MKIVFKVITFVFVLFLETKVMSQQKLYAEARIKEVLNSNWHDTIKAQELYAFISETRINDVKKAKKYTKIFYTIVKRADYKIGLGYYYFICAETAVHQNNLDIAIKNAVNASEIFHKLHAWQDYLAAITILCNAKVENNNLSESIYIAKNALKLTSKFDLPIPKVGLYLNLAYAHERKKLYNEAIKYYNYSLKISNKNNFLEGVIATYNSLSTLYNKTGNYKEAVENADKAINLNEKLINFFPENIYSVYLNKAIACTYIGNIKESNKLLSIVQSNTKDNNTRNEAAIRIAINNYRMGNRKESLSIALDVIGKTENPFIEMLCNYCVAINKYEETKYNEAEIYLKKTVNIFDKNNYSDIETLNIITESKKKLCKIAISKNENEKSVKLLDDIVKLEADKLKISKYFELNKLTTNVDLAQKKEEINKLSNENTKKQLEIESGQKKAFMLIASLFIALLILLFIYRSYTNKKRNSEQLAIRNEIIENQKSELERNLSEKNLLIKEIHHRVKNNFQMVISMLNLQVNADNVTDINQFLEEATSRILSMALIHESLYNTENLDEINFKKYVDELIESMIAAYTSSENRLSFDIDIPEYTIDIQTAIPLGLILNEMILNTIKYVQPGQLNTIIAINLQLIDNEEFILQYYDNGRVFKTIEKRKGSFGTELITLLVEQIKGQLIIENKPGVTYKVSFNDKNNAIV